MLSRDLIAFQLFDWLEIDREGDVDRETVLAIVDMATGLATDAFLPHYRQSDIEEPRIEPDGVHILPAIRDALHRYRELGLFGASFSEAQGGLGLPTVVARAVFGIFASANIATSAYAMLTMANARLLSAFGSPEQIAGFAQPQIEGRWFGTMCLSEPQAGSSLADVRTRATPDGEDEYGTRYRLVGNKMWISGGDQNVSENIVHLVLAKVVRPEGGLPEGSKGISLFIVPKLLPDGARNDVAVAGLNHKMGYRGTANCLLNFGEAEGAIGWRVGVEGQGLAQMFMMMNEARIGVGMGAAVLAYRGYRHAARYARERIQGRALGSRSETAPLPIIAHPDVRLMLLQAKVYAEGAVALCLYCSRLVDRKDEESQALLALLTPAVKSWPSEFGLAANDLAIQVHGGYGYTRDFDVEQLWRDNRLNPIHEGTTGVQAIDLLRRKLLLSNGRALALLNARIAVTARAAATSPALASHATALTAFWEQLGMVVEGLRRVDPARAFDDATLFLRAFGHGVVAWLWLDQAIHAARFPPTPLRAGVAEACRFFFDTELPQAATWLGIVAAHRDFTNIDEEVLFA